MRWKYERYLENWRLALFWDGVSIIATAIIFNLVLPGQGFLIPGLCFGALACLVSIVGMIIHRAN